MSILLKTGLDALYDLAINELFEIAKEVTDAYGK